MSAPSRFHKLCVPVPKDDRDPDGPVRWARVGTAWYDPARDRIRIRLDALPLTRTLVAFPPSEEDLQREAKGRQRREVAREAEDPGDVPDRDAPDDDIPF